MPPPLVVPLEARRSAEEVALGTDYSRIPRHRSTSVIRKRPPIGPYSRLMSRVLQWSYGGGRVRISVVTLYKDNFSSDISTGLSRRSDKTFLCGRKGLPHQPLSPTHKRCRV